MAFTPRQRKIIEAQAVAHRCGSTCFHPEGSIERAIAQLDTGAGEFLSEREMDARQLLMPATWKQAFAAGWLAAEGRYLAAESARG